MQSEINFKLNKELRTLTEKEAISLGARATLRALPYALQKGSGNRDTSLLAVCRGAIMHAPAMLSVSSDARFAARTAALSLAGMSRTEDQLDSKEQHCLAAANGAARAASHYQGRVDAQKEVADAAADAIRAYYRVSENANQFYLNDLSLLRMVTSAEAVFEEPLFPEISQTQYPQGLQVLEEFFAADPKKWRFWKDWYEGYLTGNPINWQLQSQIALLPEEYWLHGPSQISVKIEELMQRGNLTCAIDEAEAELQAASNSRHGIGGNYPPEAIAPSHVNVVDELLTAWAPLQELRQELEAENPIKSVIQDVLKTLRGFLSAGFQWAANKADLAVDTTIKWGIPAIGGGYLALNPEKIEAVVQAAERWLMLLH